MVELYINNQACTIKDLKIELNITNPFLSDKNSHTLDITLPLTNENNARIFKFLNRFDKPIKNSESYYGVIRNDGVVIFDGDVSILEVDDESIKIQIVKKEKYFRFKDSDDTRSFGSARLDLQKFGYIQDDDAGFLATMTSYQDYFVQPAYEGDPAVPLLNNLLGIGGPVRKSSQPKIYSLLKRILQYYLIRIEESFLDGNQDIDKIVIISNKEGDLWSDHLPAWTVAKFFTEFEKLFNCEILFKIGVPEVYIRSKKIFLEKTICIDSFDDYTTEIQDTGKGLNLYQNVCYNFPDNIYYKEADLDTEQDNAIKLTEIDLGTIPNNDSSMPQKFKYKNSEGTWYDGVFCRYDQNDEGFKPGTLRPINNYKSIGDKNADNVIKLDIIPCKHTCYYQSKPNSGGLATNLGYAICCVAEDYEKPEPVVQKDSFSIIKEGLLPMPNENDSPMYIAMEGLTFHNLLQGMKLGFCINNATNDPNFLFPSKYAGDTGSYFDSNLSLEWLKKTFWTNENIDTTNKIKIKTKIDFMDSIDKLKVNIKNKLFIIESVKYTIDKNGLNPIAELELYPLKEQS